VRDNEWALGALQASDAWGASTGQGGTVAVLDTGVDPNHADLSGQVTTGPDLVGGDARPGDPFWGVHGTAMASAVAGHGHGAGGRDGVMGVAPGAKILSIRVVWDDNDPIRRMTASQRAAAGARTGNSVADGIRYAVDHDAQVINMSLGEATDSSGRMAETDTAVRYAIAHGVVLVASAGNGAETSNETEFPAAYPGVIAVAAIDRSGHRATFSTHDWPTSVAAPGVGVVAAQAGGGYLVGDGTSPAAALVSGVAALVRARYPRLTPAQVKSVLERTASRPAGAYTEELGWGVVQAAAALRMAATLSPEPVVPSPAPAPGRTLGAGRAPAVGLRALDVRLLAAGLAAVSAGGLCLAGAVLLAVLRRRPASAGTGRQ
ncbi:MAG TPA: S8 family serine peptidase, partial [Candidatus Dormibacteraeota bacterium]|nr:S8 family serine peptidase [Candidatus Dormibacteraeota bacterium]